MSRLIGSSERLLGRLEWTVIRRLDGLLQGDYRTLFRGFGLDLAELREYQAGDDVRYIDWNVTARMGTPYVRQYNEDREVTAWFLLDMSPSMDFGSFEVAKRGMLIDFVGVLARLLTRHGNRVGAILYNGRIERIIPARSGRRHVLYLLHTLVTATELPESPPTNLQELFATAARFMERRSLVFIVSDFFSLPGWGRPLASIARRHEALAVRLNDPLERELPDVGILLVRDAETGEQLYVDTHNRGFRKRFVSASRRREAELSATFTEAGVDLLELSTGEELVESIVRFAELRKQRKMMVAGVNPPSRRGGRHDLSLG